MALVTADLDARIQVEGKDSVNQFATQRANFLRDTCIDISTAQEYYWLYEALTLTVPTPNTDWFAISSDFHQVETVHYVDSYGERKWFKYVDEKDYTLQYYEITNSSEGFFRIRWNDSSTQFEMALINPPAAGSSIIVLIKKYLNDASKFPDFMEEVLVRGSVGRFLAMLQGNDLEAAQNQMEEYRTLAKQQDKLGNNRLNHAPRRTKTQKELQQSDNLNRYRT